MDYIKNEKTGLYEAPTDELRQTYRTIHCSCTPGGPMFPVDVINSVQRKWLVQDGEVKTLGDILRDQSFDYVLAKIEFSPDQIL